jgi:hypothetical protein
MKLLFWRVAPLGILALPAAAGAYLLEQDAYAYDIGYSIGDPDAHWQVFQPFDVTDDEWHITSIGVDGFTVSDNGNSGAMLRLMLDDGAGHPDEGTNLGNRRVDFASNGGAEHWSYVSLTATLVRGRYWMRLSPGNGAYWSAIYNSETGLRGFSRNSDGFDFTNTFATVLRIDGSGVPEPTPLLLLAGGIVITLRRRRS